MTVIFGDFRIKPDMGLRPLADVVEFVWCGGNCDGFDVHGRQIVIRLEHNRIELGDRSSIDGLWGMGMLVYLTNPRKHSSTRLPVAHGVMVPMRLGPQVQDCIRPGSRTGFVELWDSSETGGHHCF